MKSSRSCTREFALRASETSAKTGDRPSIKYDVKGLKCSVGVDASETLRGVLSSWSHRIAAQMVSVDPQSSAQVPNDSFGYCCSNALRYWRPLALLQNTTIRLLLGHRQRATAWRSLAVYLSLETWGALSSSITGDRCPSSEGAPNCNEPN